MKKKVSLGLMGTNLVLAREVEGTNRVQLVTGTPVGSTFFSATTPSQVTYKDSDLKPVQLGS